MNHVERTRHAEAEGSGGDSGGTQHAVRVAQTSQMLKAVLDGDTYDVVAARFGVTRTTIERRVKVLAVRLCKTVGVEGLREEATAFALRLRRHRDAILVALRSYRAAAPFGPRERRVLTRREIDDAVARIGRRSPTVMRDQALLLILFATGARPLEIARLEVRDFLDAEGNVRQVSEMRPEAAINGKARPLLFVSARLVLAIEGYLQERKARGHGVGEGTEFRGLDPRSRLFLTPQGTAFSITRYGRRDQCRYLSRDTQEAYRKVFRHAQLWGVTPLAARYTVAQRLHELGAGEDQIAALLGIAKPSGVRSLLVRRRERALSDLAQDLV
jgi:integrase